MTAHLHFFLWPPRQRGMLPVFSILLPYISYSLLTFFTLILAYAVSGLGKLMLAQYFSHLGELGCPPVPSYFWGHLQLLHDAENTNLYMKWMEQLGTVFTYRGFIGVCFMFTPLILVAYLGIPGSPSRHDGYCCDLSHPLLAP